MAAFQLMETISKVLTVLDQNQGETVLSADEDTLNMQDVIYNQIHIAAERIIKIAPLRLFSDTVLLVDTSVDADDVIDSNGRYTTGVFTAVDTNGKAVITLPSDYARLAIVQMSDWKTPVREAVLDNTDIYQTTVSDFDGIKPNVYRPLAVETEDAENNPILELWGSESTSATLLKGRYIPHVDTYIEGTVDMFDFPLELYYPLVHMTAALVAQTYKDTGTMQVLMNLAYSEMGISTEPSK